MSKIDPQVDKTILNMIKPRMTVSPTNGLWICDMKDEDVARTVAIFLNKKVTRHTVRRVRVDNFGHSYERPDLTREARALKKACPPPGVAQSADPRTPPEDDPIARLTVEVETLRRHFLLIDGYLRYLDGDQWLERARRVMKNGSDAA